MGLRLLCRCAAAPENHEARAQDGHVFQDVDHVICSGVGARCRGWSGHALASDSRCVQGTPWSESSPLLTLGQ